MCLTMPSSDTSVAKRSSKKQTKTQVRTVASRYTRCREVYACYAAQAFALNRLLENLKGKTTTVKQQLEVLQRRARENDALVDYLNARKRFLRAMKWNTDQLQ
jgi:predicted RNase H-like nuclease (RuvC/YqgF family)